MLNLKEIFGEFVDYSIKIEHLQSKRQEYSFIIKIKNFKNNGDFFQLGISFVE